MTRLARLSSTLLALASAVLLALTALATPLFAAEEGAAPRPAFGNQIRHITGDLYRAGNGAWHSIFLVTSEGIILADPLNPGFAAWLKTQLDEQFDVPVKYVIYSHSHWDHVEGAAVFKDTATIIAHEGVLANMDGRYPNMPGNMIDRNGNGNFDREDIDVPTLAHPGICGMSTQFFDQVDTNKDGSVPPAEFQQNIVRPDLVYSERMTLTLGGKTVELMHPGRNHGNDMTVVLFPAERVVFATDMIADALVRANIRSLPSACGPLDGHPIAEWIASYKAVQALDFDTFAGGHGDFFTKADIAAPIQFLEDLQAAVSQAIAEGKTLEQMKTEITLEQYKDWEYYERLREMNIEAAYQNLMLFAP
jgi:glyoxylase-like metal-dependent hydrolase (beta-lactamase superfamily II)